jgi:serine/threonine-protein kinase RIO1
VLLTGVNCPETVHLKKHVLVMEMIADEHGPALKLKDTIFNSADLCIAYDQVVEVKLINCGGI